MISGTRTARRQRARARQSRSRSHFRVSQRGWKDESESFGSLRPQIGSYKETPDVPEHWLIAEEVAAVDPALIGLNDGKPCVVKTQNVVADLVAVVEQQQRQIEELKRLIAAK
jgi:hypothetical protein